MRVFARTLRTYRVRAMVIPLGLLAVIAASSGVAAGSMSATVPDKVATIAPTKCGQNVTFQHSGTAFNSLSPAGKSLFSEYQYPVATTPWSTFKGVKPPWKIGFISLPINNPWEESNYNQLKKDFAAAKAKGLVTGQLQTYIQTSFATATPEQQDAAIQQMVKSGVNAIMLHALNANAEAPAIDAAGKAGVPVIQQDDSASNSVYSINNFSQNNSPTYSGTLGLMVKNGLIGPGKTVNVLIVRGIAGFAVEQGFYDDAVADLKPCPGVHVVGTVFGQWNSATAKSEVLKFLASHPEKIDLVIQTAVGAGVIQAFQEAGRPLPVINFAGNTGGDLSYWLAHKTDFASSVGGFNGGFPTAYATFRTLLRVLAGDGLKVRDMHFPAILVTSADVAKVATPGKPLTWIGDITGPPSELANNSELNLFFNKPGTPGNL